MLQPVYTHTMLRPHATESWSALRDTRVATVLRFKLALVNVNLRWVVLKHGLPQSFVPLDARILVQDGCTSPGSAYTRPGTVRSCRRRSWWIPGLLSLATHSLRTPSTG